MSKKRINIEFIKRVYGCPRCNTGKEITGFGFAQKKRWIFKRIVCCSCGWHSLWHLSWKFVWAEYYKKCKKKDISYNAINCEICPHNVVAATAMDGNDSDRICDITGYSIVYGKCSGKCPQKNHIP